MHHCFNSTRRMDRLWSGLQAWCCAVASALPALVGLTSLIVCIPSSLIAQENRNDRNLLLLPTSVEARGKLKQSCQMSNEKPLRFALADINGAYKLPFWVDRRVDLMQPAIVKRLDDSQTLGEELVRLAVSCGIQGGFVENIYVMAQSNRLARIQRSAVVLHGQLASKNRALATQSQALEWPDITSSNELLQIISRKWNVELPNVELPHDLMHEGMLPKCSLSTQLALLLAGFDLQATIDPASTQDRIRLKFDPLSSSSAWDDTYQRSPSEATLKELRNRYPNGSLELVKKDAVKVRGETNLHSDLLTPPAAPKRSNNNSEQRYTLAPPQKVPVNEVVKTLSESMKFEVVWASECTVKHRSELIQFSVTKVTRAELLKTIADAANLRFVDEGKRLLIYPK
ncbi:MAG: hypothetical protein U0930_01290 [Pirellulales bacterium]